MVSAKREKRADNCNQFQYSANYIEVLLIFIQVRKGNNFFSNGLDVDLVEDVIEERVDELIGLVNIHGSITFFKIYDEAVN